MKAGLYLHNIRAAGEQVTAKLTPLPLQLAFHYLQLDPEPNHFPF